MLHNLTEKTAKIDVFMRMFESLVRSPCVIAVYRENALLKFSRCRGKLYDALDSFKPLEAKENPVTHGGPYVIDEYFKPLKTAKDCSDEELKGRIMVVPFKPTKIMEGSEVSPSSPSSPRRRNLNRGVFLFIDLSTVNMVSRLFMNPELMDIEYLQLPVFFSKIEKDLLTKVDSK